MHDLKDFVIVFDLDDTLYSERDYVISGINFLEDYLKNVYKKETKGLLLEAYFRGVDDFLDLACKNLQIPSKSKEALLWIYRLHKPNIRLVESMKNVLLSLTDLRSEIAILTDGRSITQRLKINALGLAHLPVYISEEYNSEKPDKKRFLAIEKHFPQRQYVYIADNPQKDFFAPLELNWICIGANWIEKRIHNMNPKKMPNIYLDSPYDIKDYLLKYS